MPSSMDSLRVASGSVSTDLRVVADDGGAITVSDWGTEASFGALTVGDAGGGSLLISNLGHVVLTDPAQGLYCGYGEHSSGTLTISGGAAGNGSCLDANGAPIYVSREGEGTLRVLDGGALQDAGPLYVGGGPETPGPGAGGHGTVDIQNAFVDCWSVEVARTASSTGTMTLEGSSTNCVLGVMRIGVAGAGTVAVGEGARLSVESLELAEQAGASGALNVDGTSTVYSIDSGVWIGKGGVGEMSITGGAAASKRVPGGTVEIGCDAGSTGTLTVSGMGDHRGSQFDAGTATVRVGYQGEGTLRVLDGGVLWNAGDLCVGADGAGAVEVRNGTLSCADVVVAGTASSTGTMTFAGSSTNCAMGDMTIGAGGAGTVGVGDGVVLGVGSLVLGDQANSSGALSVDGTSTTYSISSGVWIGRGGVGEMNITGGAAVLVEGPGGTVEIGCDAGSTGTLAISGMGDHRGSQFDAGGAVVRVGYQGEGTLRVLDGGVLWNAADLCVGADGAGAVEVRNGTLSCADVVVAGTASSTGAMTFAGSATDCALGDMTIGAGGGGTVGVGDGAVLGVGRLVLGDQAGSSGALSVDGTSTSYSVDSDVWIGKGGVGEMSITGGAAVLKEAPGGTVEIGCDVGSAGTLTISGMGDRFGSWLDAAGATVLVGCQGEGTLRVLDGAELWDAGDLCVGSGLGANGGSGAVEVRNGALSCCDVEVGGTANSTGVMTLEGSSTDCAMHDMRVGVAGAGTVHVTDGAEASGFGVAVGADAGSVGTVYVNGDNSVLRVDEQLLVGQCGQGTVHVLDGGSLSVPSWSGQTTYIGLGAGSQGTLSVNGDGAVASFGGGDVCFGNSSNALVRVLNGSAVQDIGTMTFGWTDRGRGTLEVRDGTVSVNSIVLGTAGNTSTLGMWGGELNVAGDVADGPGESRICIDGGQMSVGGSLNVDVMQLGLDAAADHTQRAGSRTINANLYVGMTTPPATESAYTLDGGSLNVDGILYVGWGAKGVLNAQGGTLAVHDLQVGNVVGSGTLRLSGEASVTVSDRLVLGPGASLDAEPCSILHMTGSDFTNRVTDPLALSSMSNLTLVFEGGAGELDSFEAAGRDWGMGYTGFSDNFALGVLQLGGAAPGHLRLVDTIDNQLDWTGSEVLYVSSLAINSGSTLDLNGLTLYCSQFSGDPAAVSLNGGQLVRIYTPCVPEPTGIALLGVGALVACLRRKRQAARG